MRLLKQFNVLFQLLNRTCLLLLRMNKREECDAAASPNNESTSETGDSEADPNYSFSDDSYSDTSDK